MITFMSPDVRLCAAQLKRSQRQYYGKERRPPVIPYPSLHPLPLALLWPAWLAGRPASMPFMELSGSFKSSKRSVKVCIGPSTTTDICLDTFSASRCSPPSLILQLHSALSFPHPPSPSLRTLPPPPPPCLPPSPPPLSLTLSLVLPLLALGSPTSALAPRVPALASFLSCRCSCTPALWGMSPLTMVIFLPSSPAPGVWSGL